MRKVLISALVFAVSFFGIGAYAQQWKNTASAGTGANSLIRSGKFRRDFVQAPTYEAGGMGSFQIPQTKTGKWFVTIFEYVPNISYDRTSAGKAGKRKFNWIDGITADLYALIPGSDGYGAQILLSGSQKFWSIACDGKLHRIFFAVPPLIFERYSSMDKFNRSSAETIPLMLLLKDQSQREIARFVQSAPGLNPVQTQARFQQMIQANLNVFKLKDSILPKEKSPWQWLEIEAFDMPKSVSEGK